MAEVVRVVVRENVLLAERGVHADIEALTGQPPADVVGALFVPDGAKATASENDDGGLSTYDRAVKLPKSTFSFPVAP